jgi:hypothetical protein
MLINFESENLTRRSDLKGLGRSGRMILREWSIRLCLEESGCCPMAGSCKDGFELSAYTKSR